MNITRRVPGITRNSGWQAIDAEIASRSPEARTGTQRFWWEPSLPMKASRQRDRVPEPRAREEEPARDLTILPACRRAC